MNQYEKENTPIESSLNFYLSLGNIEVQEMLQISNMMNNYQELLSQHKAPIRQLSSDKRWKTRLPNGRQIVKTHYLDLINALVDYYADTAPINTVCTLKTLYPEWLTLREMEVSTNTLSKTIRSWNNYFSDSDIVDIAINELTRSYMKAWATDLIRTHSMTKHYFASEIKTILNDLLDYAVDKEITDSNKFRGIKINSRVFKPKDIKEDTEDVFTLEEEQLIMAEAEKDSLATNSALPLGINILFCTGIRVGELCGLKYGDIKGNILTIQRMQIVKKIKVNGKIQSSGYEIVEHTKTSAGYRKIYLPQKALEYFDRIKTLNQMNGFSSNDDDYIFRRNNHYAQMQNDDLANSRVFDSRIRKYCKKAGLDYRKSPHDIRRTYITLLYDSGMNIDAIRKIAGHENIEMTLAYCRSRNTAELLSDQIENAFKAI